jgi:hypothetical protein
VPNGPIQIGLENDKRYRFFLKGTSKPGIFVGVLDGQYDDGFAVIPLIDTEHDDSAYIPSTEAIQIAQRYMEKNYPDIPCVIINDSDRQAQPKPRPNPPPQPYWRADLTHSFAGAWVLNLSKISDQRAVVESKTLKISPDRTVSVTNP